MPSNVFIAAEIIIFQWIEYEDDMSAVEAFGHLLGKNFCILSKKEATILEAALCAQFFDELMEAMKDENSEYFQLIKIDSEESKTMIEENFIRCVINDILLSQEYTLPGIVCYTDTPEDVIYEILIGKNLRPTFTFCRKLIDLHRNVRQQLYQEIVSKVIDHNVGRIEGSR